MRVGHDQTGSGVSVVRSASRSVAVGETGAALIARWSLGEEPPPCLGGVNLGTSGSVSSHDSSGDR